MGVFRVIGLCLVSALWFIVGCSSGGDGGDNGGPVDPGNEPKNIAGTAQKGPFITGSSVTINLLTETGQATTDTTITYTDNLGNFKFQLNSPSLVQIRVDGYYFNEISGAVSNSPITLNATYDTSVSDFVVVNVLTHLINNRVRFLLEQGNTVSAATAQAQTELITALSDVLLVTSLPDFTQLSVYNLDSTNPTGNAYLLALTATLYNYANIEVGGDSGLLSGKLAETINTLAADLEPDGVFDNTTIISSLTSATTSLNPDQIKAGLINRSIEVLGEALAVPDVNLFIDTDQDGEVNSVDSDDDGDGINDAEDPNPYQFDNIPKVETFSISFDDGPAIVYNEVEDNTLPTGFQTRIGAHFDQTRVVSGVNAPTPIIYLDQYQEDGTYTWLHLFLPAEAPGTYYIDDITNVRYFSYTANETVNYKPHFNYTGVSGSITISEYGEFGYAVVGSYDITLSCLFDDVTYCNAGDLRRITGEFTLARDDVQHFLSVGSSTSPVNLGDFPFRSLSSIKYPPYVYLGTNKNTVSPSAPSYYQFSVNPLNQYKIEITNNTGGVKLSVYGTSDFDKPLCESIVSPISCTVAQVSDTLYFTVSMLNPTELGAWFRLLIEPATFVDEGAADSPVDITAQSPYTGQVGLGVSFYRYSVTPGTIHNFTFRTLFGNLDFQVATDSSFTNVVCQTRTNTYNDSCNLSIDPAITELFVKVYRSTSSISAIDYEGGFFQIENWEITLPIYKIQIKPTPVGIDTDACAYPTIYEIDGTRVKGLHQLYRNECSTDGFNGTIPLEPGKTYNIELRDGLGYSPSKADYYAIWFGMSDYLDPLNSITPDTTLNEPSNNSSSGAIPLGFETLHYDSFLSDDNDYDWYTITIPTM